jgi:hypothetical protein
VIALAAVVGIAMNFSARRAGRKWAFGRFSRGHAAMVTAAAALLLLIGPAAAARKSGAWLREPWGGLLGAFEAGHRTVVRQARREASVPLPRPRPAEAPATGPQQPAVPTPAPAEPDRASEQTAPAPPPPSACRLALTDQIAIAPSIPDIHGAGGCGGTDLVRLEAVVLPDKHLVAVKPPATLRCAMASAVADWIRTDMAPLAAKLGSVITDLDNFDSFECRSRNRVAGAPLSEHGRANALDVRALKLANGQSITLTDRTVPRDLRESVLHSVCARFSTVLGPGSDWYHEEHIHLDLMARHNNYKICDWNVWDPLPQIAPLLPAERPEQAPPRETAAKADAVKSEPAEAGSGDAATATKKRR